MNRPRSGEVLRIGAAASVQFAGDRALLLRVVSVCERPTYHGWIWPTGYVLDRHGEAVGRREVYVRAAGLRRVPPAGWAACARVTTSGYGDR